MAHHAHAQTGWLATVSWSYVRTTQRWQSVSVRHTPARDPPTRDYAPNVTRCMRCQSDLKNINAAVFNARWTNGNGNHFDTREVIGPVSRIILSMRSSGV